jgi:hypothetical protein
MAGSRAAGHCGLLPPPTPTARPALELGVIALMLCSLGQLPLWFCATPSPNPNCPVLVTNGGGYSSIKMNKIPLFFRTHTHTHGTTHHTHARLQQRCILDSTN